MQSFFFSPNALVNGWTIGDGLVCLYPGVSDSQIKAYVSCLAWMQDYGLDEGDIFRTRAEKLELVWLTERVVAESA